MPSGINLITCQFMNARQVVVRIRHQIRFPIKPLCAIAVVLLVEDRAEVVIRQLMIRPRCKREVGALGVELRKLGIGAVAAQ